MEERDGIMSEKRPGSGSAGTGPGRPDGAGISTARKVRLVGLVCLLLVVVGTAVGLKVRERRAEEARRQELADGIRRLREIIPRLGTQTSPEAFQAELGQAGELLTRLDELEPGNREVMALTVPMLYQVGKTVDALQLFNEMGPGPAEADYRRGALALADFQFLIVDAAGAEIREEGLRYLSSCSLLWDLARRIARDADTDEERALAVAAWMAANLGASDSGTVPADPSLTCARGYGTPVELAWTFSELLRQLDVPSRVLVPEDEEETRPAGYIVQVLARDGDPILLDTNRCVPLLGPGTGAPVALAELQQNADLRQQLAAQAGQEAEALEYIPAARLLLALHPYTCYRRFIGFDRLLAPLARHPRMVLDFDSLPSADVPELWDGPVAIVSLMISSRYPNVSRRDLAPLDMMPWRDAQLRGMPGVTRSAYEQLILRMRDELARADVEEGAETLRRTIEMATFFGASAALEAGEPADAVQKLRRFLEQQPESRFAAPAAVLLAEALGEAGETDAAEEAWQAVPAPRARYAQLRLEGAVPGPALAPEPVPQLEPEAAPE
jgi:tetratricopeptide (TPR) repeat protein